MNIKEIIKLIDNPCNEQDVYSVVGVGYEDLQTIKGFIESQQKTIESMKCCGNCKHLVAGSNNCIKDVFDITCFYRDPINGLKGHWESDI